MLQADDPGALRVYVDEGREATKRHLEHVLVAIEKYHGGLWVTTGGRRGAGTEYNPENTYFEYMTAMLPRLVFHNPRVRVSSRRSGPQTDVATAMRLGLNKLAKDTRLRFLLRDIALDMLFAWGVVLVKEDERKGLSLSEDDPLHPAKPTWPVAERVPPAKFFMDPLARDWPSTRYQGHEWKIDKDDLLERARKFPKEGWNVDAIEALSVDVEDDLGLYPVDRPENYRPRSQVCAYDVWFPEIELDESPGPDRGFHGTVYTIAVGQSSSEGSPRQGFIRKPRPFYGPRTGPYTLFGVYKVPDSPFPLSPLIAVEQQIREMNVHSRVSSENMRKYKRAIGVRDQTTAERIKNSPHDHVVALDLEDPRNAVAEFEVAGISEQTIVYEDRKRAQVNRLIGMDETMRGVTKGGVTATETTLASESSTARVSEIKSAFTNAVADVFYSQAHYLYYSDTVVFPLSEEVTEELGVKVPEYPGVEVRPWFRGGEQDRDSGYTFEDLELEIEPYSMELTSEGLQMQRMFQSHELVMGMLPMMERFPDFPWREWAKKVGDSMNMPNMEELIRPEMLQRLAKQLEMMMQAQAEPRLGTGEPRLGSHVGGAAAGGSRPASGGGAPRSMASQGQGQPTAARIMGGGMPGQKAGAGFGGLKVMRS